MRSSDEWWNKTNSQRKRSFAKGNRMKEGESYPQLNVSEANLP
jgi:hypothetical protein